MGAAESSPEVLLKLEQVEAQTGMKKSYIYREMEKGTFPPRHKVGGGTRWCQSDIQRWIAAKSQAPRWFPNSAEGTSGVLEHNGPLATFARR